MRRAFMRFFLLALMLGFSAFAMPSPSFAADYVAEPHARGLNLQEAASPVKERVDVLHDHLLVIIFAISIFVLLLMLWIIWRYRASANPKPANFTHNFRLEVIWTLVPVLILAYIGWQSLPLLYYMDKTKQAELTIKVTGHQWYWTYEYPDSGINIEARPIWSSVSTTPEQAAKDVESFKAGWIQFDGKARRLLETDNRLVLPANTNVRVLVTAADVLHSWAVPSLGVKKDAIPGRLNETWFSVNKPGLYFGQCSEICGEGHGFMPIAIDVLSREDFAAWLAKNAPAKTAETAPAPAAESAPAQVK